MLWSSFKGTALPRWEVPTSTGMFMGVRDYAWIIVTARLRSSSRVFTPLHLKQAHGDTGGILTPQLIHSQPRKARLSFRTPKKRGASIFRYPLATGSFDMAQ